MDYTADRLAPSNSQPRARPAPDDSGRQTEVRDHFLRTLRSTHDTYRLDDTYSSAPLWTVISWFTGSSAPVDAEGAPQPS